ncbi:MAG: hypothetical protein L0Z55_00855 [Planctomycetes bacterium]|nr:hypothetical protein [Planctomycetota bacterium]
MTDSHGHGYGADKEVWIEDPSWRSTLIVGLVGVFFLVACIYWVSGAFYDVEERIIEESFVTPEIAAREQYRTQQARRLAGYGVRKLETGGEALMIPIERAMEIVARERGAGK